MVHLSATKIRGDHAQRRGWGRAGGPACTTMAMRLKWAAALLAESSAAEKHEAGVLQMEQDCWNHVCTIHDWNKYLARHLIIISNVRNWRRQFVPRPNVSVPVFRFLSEERHKQWGLILTLTDSRVLFLGKHASILSTSQHKSGYKSKSICELFCFLKNKIPSWCYNLIGQNGTFLCRCCEVNDLVRWFTSAMHPRLKKQLSVWIHKHKRKSLLSMPSILQSFIPVKRMNFKTTPLFASVWVVEVLNACWGITEHSNSTQKEKVSEQGRPGWGFKK